jgi:hypothetical protein
MKILEEAIDWHSLTTISKTKKLWQKQACPGKKQWAMFRNFFAAHMESIVGATI